MNWMEQDGLTRFSLPASSFITVEKVARHPCGT